jgi:hypothetical protein
MRIVIVSLLAAAVAGLAVSADADAATASKKKQRYAASKDKAAAKDKAAKDTTDHGYMASPENFPVGTSRWWQAMERTGRGGFGDIP